MADDPYLDLANRMYQLAERLVQLHEGQQAINRDVGATLASIDAKFEGLEVAILEIRAFIQEQRVMNAHLHTLVTRRPPRNGRDA